MNPFDLSGPEFLVLYVILGSLTVRITRWYVERREAEGPLPPLTNAEQIALLRGGTNEAMRICALTLLDRGLIIAKDNDEKVATRYGLDVDGVRRPLEQALLRKFERSAAIRTMYDDPAIQRACEPIERPLRERGLLMSEQIAESRRDARKVALMLLIGIATAKVVVALSQGRTNVILLIVLALGFSAYLVYRLNRPGRTGLGELVIEDLQRLFKRRRSKVRELRAGQNTDEAALLAAVFGLSVLPVAAYPFLPHLFPRALKESSSNASSSSGSSCGSSGCGGSDSSGCGGGGGCGGCGG